MYTYFQPWLKLELKFPLGFQALLTHGIWICLVLTSACAEEHPKPPPTVTRPATVQADPTLAPLSPTITRPAAATRRPPAPAVVTTSGATTENTPDATPSLPTSPQKISTPVAQDLTPPTDSEVPAPRGSFMQISSGYLHSCAIRVDGTPVCWGDDSVGQVDAPKGENFKTISSGMYHTCALRIDGSPVCWGNTIHGEKFSAPEGERFTQVSSNGDNACGLRGDGTIGCWGSQYFAPVASPQTQDFVSVTTGSQIGCGLRSDGSVGCWALYAWRDEPETTGGKNYSLVSSGDNYSCAIRQEGGIDCWQHYSARKRIAGPPGGDFVAISAGDDYACALRSNGRPVCWLAMMDGCIDCVSLVQNYGQWEPPKGIQLQEISTGPYHACGLSTDGKAICWGTGVSNVQNEQFTAFDSGGYQTCGLRVNGSAKCWGPFVDYGGYGEYTAGTLTNITVGDSVCGLRNSRNIYCSGSHWGPRMLAATEEFIDIETAGYQLCGLRINGTLICMDSWNTEHVPSALDERKFIDLSLGAFVGKAIVCGLLETRHVACWHKDGGGNYSPATYLPESQRYLVISASDDQVCGVLLDKSLVCAPDVPNELFAHSPTPTDGMFIDVSVGDGFACALREDGTPACWGVPGYGRTLPPEGEQFTSISSGRMHACGLRGDKSVVCWGWHDRGQAKPPE